MAKIEYKTLNERAYAALKKELIAGEFRPGHVLVIRAVADAYGISATPVREALQRLVAERLLQMLPNRSIVVPHLSLENFTELCRIRCTLEGLAGELAAAHTSDSHVHALQRIVHDIEHAIETRDGRTYVQLNQTLHFSLYERAQSPLLLEMIQDLWCRVGPFFNALFDDLDYIPHANEYHLKILAALRKRDAAQVRQHVVDDISTAARTLAPRLREHIAILRETARQARQPVRAIAC